MKKRLVSLLGTLGLLVAAGAQAATTESRVLDSEGRVLTVGNWRTVDVDGGPLRVEDLGVLSFEWRSLDGSLLAEGIVPGTESAQRIDTSPVLSRNPATGELLLVWSRVGLSGLREIASQRFGGAYFDIEPRIIARGSADQVDPDLLHDQNGNAYVTWRSLDWAQRVQLVALDPRGDQLFHRELSTDETLLNGSPRLGVDAAGSLFVAYLGLETVSSEPVLKVHAANDSGGGVIHVPNPIIELGRVSEVSVLGSVPGPSAQGWSVPRLEVTVLGGTPVLWWTTEDGLGREVLNHATRTADGVWDDVPVGRIPLTTLGDPDVALRRALEMIEARYRSVTTLVGQGQGQEPPGRAPGNRLDVSGIGLHR